MTYEKALELLNNMEFKHEYQGKDEYGDMLVKIKDALEKQIPKNPIEDVSKDYEGNIIDEVFFCPKCTRTICFGCETDIKENYPYCNCGQKIDWSDTDEQNDR